MAGDIYPTTQNLTIRQAKELLKKLLLKDLQLANSIMVRHLGQDESYDWSAYIFERCSPDAPPLVRGLQKIVDVAKDRRFFKTGCFARPLCVNRVFGNVIDLRTIL